VTVCGHLGDDAVRRATITTILLSIDGSRRGGLDFGEVGGGGDKQSEQIHLSVCKSNRDCVVALGL